MGHDGGVRGLNHAGKCALVVVVAMCEHDAVDRLASQGLKDALGAVTRVDDKAMRRVRVAHNPTIRFDGPHNNARHFQHGLVLPRARRIACLIYFCSVSTYQADTVQRYPPRHNTRGRHKVNT